MAQNLDDYITRSANLANMDIDSIIGKTSQGNSYIPSVQQYYQNKLSQAYLNGTLQKLIDNQKEPVLAGIAKRFQDHITQQNDVSTGNAKTATDTSGTTRQQSDGSGAPSNATGNDGSAQVSTDDLSPKDNIDTSLEKAPVLQNRDRDSSASVQQSSDTGNSHLENSQDGSASLNQVTSQNNTQQTAQNELQANQTTHQVSLGGNTSLGSVNASNQSAAPTVTTTANTSSENTSPSANTSADTSTNQDTNSAEDTQKEKEWNYWFVDDLVEKTDKPTTIAILDGTEKAVQDTEQGQLTKQLVINFIEKDAKDEGTKSSDTEQGDRPSELDAQGKSTRDDSQVQGKGTSDAGSESAKSANGNEGSAQSSDEKGLSHSDTIRYSRKDKINVPKVVIAGNLGSLNNHPDYERAKKGDASAGLNVAKSLVTDKLISDVKDMIGNEKPIVVPVSSIESGGANTIPSMSSVLIAEKIGLQSDSRIKQVSSSKRTEKNGLDRIFTPVDFEGHVEKGKKYLIVDDTITQGGTFAGLENHITENGGEVIGSVALSGKQYSGTINLDQQTLKELREKYGDIERRFIDATGYGFEGLTQSEARYILGFKPPERFRERVAREADSRLDGVGKDASPNGSSNQQVTKQSDQETNKAPSKEGVSASRGLTSLSESVTEKIKALIKNALSSKSGNNHFEDLGELSKNATSIIKSSTGLELDGYVHSIDEASIRHILNRHGDEKTEQARGQLPITEADLLKIPEIVNNPDSVEKVDSNNSDVETLIFKKKIGDNYVSVQEVRSGRKKLTAKTLWKVRAAPSATSNDALTLTSETFGSQPSTTETSISKDKESGKKSEKLADFGEKIEGAKKDTYVRYADELENASDDVAGEPLSKSFPKPDYEKLIAEGSDSKAIAAIRVIREAIPSKPRMKGKLSRWVSLVNNAKELSRMLMESPAMAEDLMKKYASLSGGDAQNIMHRFNLYSELGHKHDLSDFKFANWMAKDDNGQFTIPAPEARSRQNGIAVTGKSEEDAITKFKDALKALGDSDKKPKEAQSVKFDVYQDRKNNTFYIARKIGPSKFIKVADGFKTSREAFDFRKENQQDLEEKLAKLREIPNERRDSNDPRLGEDHRQGKDVTPEHFLKTFGFKGGQFGNWVTGKERQSNVNETYDSLIDLAKLLNIPPKALSLNGQLGIAWGARGQSRASAHYEPDMVVINLTRKNGAGSLAHEWFHALDNYFSKNDGKSGYLSEQTKSSGEGIRPEVRQAFDKVLDAIKQTGLIQRSRELDKVKTKDYWSTKLEMFARAFESYVINKAKDFGYKNDYLANIVSEAEYGRENSYPYPTAGETESISKAFDHLFETLKTKETDKGTALYSRRASDMEFANDILQELAQHDDFFKHDKIESHTISGAVEEALPTARFLGDATREDEKKESGADYRLMFKTAKGNDFYVYTKGKKVWIDISRFENDNAGALIYNAIAGFAHNAGFEFIGDPAGLSPDATFRRTRAMLSSALRYGTTKHFSAANEQIRGNKEAGIAPLKWGNDDFENIKNLIDSYVQTVENKFPQLRNYNYDFGKQQYVDKAGIPVSDRRFRSGVSHARSGGESGGGNTIGTGTIRSYIFLKALLSSQDQSRPSLSRQFSNSALALIRDGGLDKLFSKKSGGIENSHTAKSLTQELTSGKKPFDIAIKRLITELQL